MSPRNRLRWWLASHPAAPAHRSRTRPAVEALEGRTVPAGWGSNLGGSADDDINRSAVDAAGNLYVAGSFSSGTVDINGDGVTDLTNPNGDQEAFLAKLSPTGALAWARGLGGVGKDTAWGVAVDPTAGNAWAVGQMLGAIDFGNGYVLPGDTTNLTTWVAKFAAANGGTLWAGRFDTVAYELAVDAVGNVFVTGGFGGTIDFDPGPGQALLTSANTKTDRQDTFVVSLSPSGTYRTAWKLGGYFGSALAVDGGAVYVAGVFNNTEDFDPGPGTRSLTSAGSDDIFLARYTVAEPTPGAFAVALDWADGVGGPLADEWSLRRALLALDGAGTVTLADEFGGTADFNPGPGEYRLTSAGGFDVFIARYNRSDGALVSARTVGGPGDDYAQVGGRDAADNYYLSGFFSGTVDFDPGAGTANRTATGGQDGYLLRLDAAGNYDTVWQFSGPSWENPWFAGVAGGLIYVTGSFGSSVTLPGGRALSSAGSRDGFAMAFDPLAAAVVGTVFNDLNGDGVNNDGAGVPGRTVFADLNGNAALDPGEPSGTSDRTGRYFLGDLALGSYTVRQALPLPAGWSPTAPAGGAHAVTLAAAGQVVAGRDFGNVIPTAVRTYASGAINRAIPSQGTVTASLSVPDGYPIYDLNVTLTINHRHSSELIVTLIAPDGTRVKLFDKVGGLDANFTDTTLDDEAGVAITAGSAPFRGSYRPQSLLGALDHKSANGTWTLEVTDAYKTVSGTLVSWSLSITGPAAGSPFAAVGMPKMLARDPSGSGNPASNAAPAVSGSPVVPAGEPTTVPLAPRSVPTPAARLAADRAAAADLDLTPVVVDHPAGRRLR